MGKTTRDAGWNEKGFIEAAQEYQLVYLFSETILDISNPSIQKVDTKITFQKSLQPSKRIDEILAYDKMDREKELENLAYLSGKYSRFKLDSRLRAKEFEKLYSRWIIQAVEQKGVLIAPESAGMVTFSVEKEQGRIGLIAVSEKHQGQGLGKKLLQAAEFNAYQLGAREMLIPTQESNIPACKLYESVGYKPIEKIHLYHYWKNE
ncbi:GNAT family N-acetyltransferase [Algoriphagus sp. D3-2-R+10]|nr:GNAT family N-acetyltransferase [Algoriphagus sp. D3-2-R+10]